MSATIEDSIARVAGVLAGSARFAVVCGDGLALLHDLADGCADALVVDPPYCSGSISEASRTAAAGQGLRSENVKKFGWFVGDNMTTAGLVWMLRTLAFHALRVVKPTGSLVVFCDWRMVPTLAPAIESAGWRWQGMIVWNKGSMGLGAGFRAQHEIALHFTAGAPEYHHRGTSNVITVDRVDRDEREHQTQKPVDLMAKILRVVCPRGGVVVDPMCGSGSTGVAAVIEGMRAILAERDEENVTKALRRLSEAERDAPSRSHVSQPSLFDAPRRPA